MILQLKLRCTHAHTGWNKNNMFELYTTSPQGQTGSVGEQSLTTHALTGSIRSQPTRLRGAYAHNPSAQGGQSLAAHALLGSNRSQPTRSWGAIAHRPRGAIQPPLSTRSHITHSARHRPINTITQHYNMHQLLKQSDYRGHQGAPAPPQAKAQ